MKDVKVTPGMADTPLVDKTAKMDRRDFLVTAGKLVIPTLGILGLSLAGKAHAGSDDCNFSCQANCVGVCQSSCTGTCKSDQRNW